MHGFATWGRLRHAGMATTPTPSVHLGQVLTLGWAPHTGRMSVEGPLCDPATVTITQGARTGTRSSSPLRSWLRRESAAPIGLPDNGIGWGQCAAAGFE